MTHHNDPEHLPEHYNLLFTTPERNLTHRSHDTAIPIDLSDGDYILEYVYICAFNPGLTRVDMDVRLHEITLEQANALMNGCGPLTCEERHVTRTCSFRIPGWVPQTIRVSARASFSVAFTVPFVSLRDFYATCKNSEALSKGVRLWLEGFEFEDNHLITVQPAARNW